MLIVIYYIFGMNQINLMKVNFVYNESNLYKVFKIKLTILKFWKTNKENNIIYICSNNIFFLLFVY